MSSVGISSRLLAHWVSIWAGCWRPNLEQETCHSEFKMAYVLRSAFVEVVDRKGSHSLRNSLKLPLGKPHPCLRLWSRNTFFRLQQGLKRFHQCLRREGLRDRDHIRHSNGTTAIPIIGANSPPSMKFHGMLTSHTGRPPTTAMYPFRQRHTSHPMWVSLQQFRVMS